MSIKLYTGEVVFPPGQPHDGGYGPSINILVKMTDPAAPKVNEKGETRIYKKLSDPDSGYLYTLGKGDRVTLAWNEAKSNYSLIYDQTGPGSPEPLPPPYSKPADATRYANKQLAHGPATQAPAREIVVEPQPPGNMEAWDYIGDYELEMYDRYLRKVVRKYPNHPDPHQLTGRIHGWAHGWWRPGAVLSGSSVSTTRDKDQDKEAFLSLVEANGGTVQAWLQATCAWLDATDKEVLEVLTMLGVSSGEWLKDDAGRWALLQALADYWTMSENGMDHREIAELLSDEHGIKAPALAGEPEPPPF